ncbi:MAG: hypothetical protein JXB07_07570 [Anaerolineae bacterium]|nr:hypothetical protein [Anaerolineae bacterium]
MPRLSFLLLFACLMTACLLAGSPVASTQQTPTALPGDIPADSSPSPISPDPPATITAQQDIENRLGHYAITVANIHALSTAELEPIVAAAIALGDKTPELFGLDREKEEDRYTAVRNLFGPTVFRVYSEREKVDGVNYAVNCGWEGRGAQGCKHPDIFPEQEFPEGAWLILMAGKPLLDDYKNTALVIHEMGHNLTWGGGHYPDNVDGFSYPRYVGDSFAIRYADTLGIQLGSDSYRDEQARGANPMWRAEITADAVASWALDLFQGPHADSVSRYIRDMLAYEIAEQSGH